MKSNERKDREALIKEAEAAFDDAILREGGIDPLKFRSEFGLTAPEVIGIIHRSAPLILLKKWEKKYPELRQRIREKFSPDFSDEERAKIEKIKLRKSQRG